MAEYQLYCLAQSGNAYRVALMLNLIGADWEPIFVDFFGKMIQRTPEYRENVNEMGEVPVLVQWMASGQKPADLQVTAVSTAYNESSENSPATAWLKRENWPTPVMPDSSNNTAADAYGLTAFPYLVVLGPDGTVKGRTTGELTPDQLTSFVNKALAS